MKKIAILAATVALLAACTTYPQSLNYRPRGSDSAPYVITSQFNNLNNHLTVFIDGHPVTDGNLSWVDGSGQFFGQYQGHKVLVSCKQISAVDAACQVTIDNEIAGEFHA